MYICEYEDTTLGMMVLLMIEMLHDLVYIYKYTYIYICTVLHVLPELLYFWYMRSI